MIMKLNNRLKECATTLLDEKLLDIMSQEFVYHPQCLANLYNRERAFLSSKDRSNLVLKKAKQKVANAFTELETYIRESDLYDKTCVYKLTAKTSSAINKYIICQPNKTKRGNFG